MVIGSKVISQSESMNEGRSCSNCHILSHSVKQAVTEMHQAKSEHLQIQLDLPRGIIDNKVSPATIPAVLFKDIYSTFLVQPKMCIYRYGSRLCLSSKGCT